MKAKFIGSGENDPEEILLRGTVFKKGKAVTVPKELEELVSGNSHFQVVKSAKNKQ